MGLQKADKTKLSFLFLFWTYELSSVQVEHEMGVESWSSLKKRECILGGGIFSNFTKVKVLLNQWVIRSLYAEETYI